MFRLKSFKFLGGISAANRFLLNNPSDKFFNGLNKNDVRKFFLWYKVLTVVQERYFEYAINKVLNKGFAFTSESLNIIFENVSHYPIEKIDAILLLVLERYSEFKFDENKALALVKVGSIYTKFLLHNYRFSKEIRLEIYNHYQDNGREDLLALYSGYLITGEANRIVDSKDADIDLSRLRKKTIDVK